jgi:hypothetical protein
LPTYKRGTAIINLPLEVRRLQLAIDTVINSPDSRAQEPREPDAEWNSSLPTTVVELNVLLKK